MAREHSRVATHRLSVVAYNHLAEGSTVSGGQLVRIQPGDDLGDLEALVQLSDSCGIVVGEQPPASNIGVFTKDYCQ